MYGWELYKIENFIEIIALAISFRSASLYHNMSTKLFRSNVVQQMKEVEIGW